jgi:hypothetical protein
MMYDSQSASLSQYQHNKCRLAIPTYWKPEVADHIDITSVSMGVSEAANCCGSMRMKWSIFVAPLNGFSFEGLEKMLFWGKVSIATELRNLERSASATFSLLVLKSRMSSSVTVVGHLEAAGCNDNFSFQSRNL